MKSSVPALCARLLADAATTALVADRVWTFEAEENSTFPDIVVYPVSGVGTPSLAGVIPPWTERVSVECRALKFSAADRLGIAVMTALNNVVFASNGVIVDGCQLVSSLFPFDEGTLVFRRVLDFSVSSRPA